MGGRVPGPGRPAGTSAKRPGPHKRQRPVILAGRFSASEASTVRTLAAANDQSIGSLIRYALLELPMPKRQRRRRVDDAALGRLLAELATVRAELGKSGSNLNQVAHYLNAGRDIRATTSMLEAALLEHEEAMRLLLELRSAALQAMGLETGQAAE